MGQTYFVKKCEGLLLNVRKAKNIKTVLPLIPQIPSILAMQK